VIGDAHRILAPTLLRSQVLSSLYQAVRRGELTKQAAERRLDYVRGLRIRLLADRVLQALAWKVATSWGGPTPWSPSTSP
jgi:predicted nucleic acid-binding protein